MDKETVTSVIKKNMANIIDGVNSDSIDIEKTMKDYGADSLEIVEVVSRSMKELKIKVPRTELAKLKNIAGLVDLFYEHASKGG